MGRAARRSFFCERECICLRVPILLLFSWLSLMAAGSSYAAEMAFFDARNGGNCNHCVWLAAEGEIVADTPQKFQDVLRGRKGLLVRMNSKGGNIIAAVELGRLFRQYEATVEVSRTVDYDASLKSEEAGECYSACALALMGGLYRQKYDRSSLGKSVIGIHRPYTTVPDIINSKLVADNIIKVDQALSGYVLQYIFEMGINPRIFTRMLKTEKDEIDILSDEDLVDLNLLNTVWKMESWTISLDGNKPVARTVSRLGNSHFATLEFSCSPSGGELISIGLRLPDSMLEGTFRGIQPTELIKEKISIGINTDDYDLEENFLISKTYQYEDLIYAEIDSENLINSISAERIIYTDLYHSMAAARQYDIFEMMSPPFSLERSARAISLIRKGC